MSDKINQLIKQSIADFKKIFEPPEPFSPSQFNDPIAEQIAWNRIGSKKICPHKLSKIDSETIEFKVTSECKPLSFFVLAIILFVFGLPNNFITLMIWAGIILIFSIGYYFTTAPIIFSKTKGYFGKGRNPNKIRAYFQKRESSEELSDNNIYEKQVPLEQIYAIQLIKVIRGTGKYRNTNYELNLVLKNKERVNVIHNGEVRHSIKAQIRKDAEELSRFLGLPVWDALDYKNI